MKTLDVLALVLFGAAPLGAQSVPAADTAFHAARWKGALELYAQALRTTPGNRAAMVRAGYSALALGKGDSAAALFRLALQTPLPATGAGGGGPAAASSAVRAGLAMARLQQGARDEGLAGLEMAVKEGYNNVGQLELVAREHGLAKDARFTAIATRAAVNAFPCLGDSVARSFDFWIGEWDVYVTGSSMRAGSNRIERVAGGCALLESWTAWQTPLAPPNEGNSLNFVDPASGKWRQVWMGSGRAQNTYVDGVYRDGAMRFAFEGRDAQGGRITGRFTFFNLAPDRVRQLQESSRDGGTTWRTDYDLTYVRQR